MYTEGRGDVKDFTVGVEEEYQLIDPASGELRSEARAVLRSDWTGDIRNEMQESTLEIGTQICADCDELREEIIRLRFQTATVAASHELAIAAAGVHPFSRWESHEMSGSERYQRIAGEYGRIARDEHNFGMHVHVAVPADCDRVQIMGRTRTYLPFLLALSCSSPYYEGADTGYASYRTILWRRWPRTGAPPRFADAEEYAHYTEALVRAGFIEDARDIYWMVRPHPVYPTLEFRACDVCPSLDDALAIAALNRVLVAAAVWGEMPEPSPASSAVLADRVLDDNLWRVARDGLDADLVSVEAAAGPRSLRAELNELLDRVEPVARALGEDDMRAGIERIMRRGNGADRMHAQQKHSRSLRELAHWLESETLLGTGVDRRRAQRAAASHADVS